MLADHPPSLLVAEAQLPLALRKASGPGAEARLLAKHACPARLERAIPGLEELRRPPRPESPEKLPCGLATASLAGRKAVEEKRMALWPNG